LQKKIAEMSSSSSSNIVTFQKSPEMNPVPAIAVMSGSEPPPVKLPLPTSSSSSTNANSQNERLIQQMEQQKLLLQQQEEEFQKKTLLLQQQFKQQQQQQQQQQPSQPFSLSVSPTSIDLDDVDEDDEELSARLDGVKLVVLCNSTELGRTKNITEIGDYGEVNVESLPAETFSFSGVKPTEIILHCVATHTSDVIGIVTIPIGAMKIGRNDGTFDVVDSNGVVFGKVGVTLSVGDGNGDSNIPPSRHIYRFSIESRSLQNQSFLQNQTVTISHSAPQFSSSSSNPSKTYTTHPFKLNDASTSSTTVPTGKGSTVLYEFIAPASFPQNNTDPIEIKLIGSDSDGSDGSDTPSLLGLGVLNIQEALPETRAKTKPTFIRDSNSGKTFYSISDFKSNSGRSGGSPIFVYASEVVVSMFNNNGDAVCSLNCAVILEDIGVSEIVGGGGDLFESLSSPMEVDGSMDQNNTTNTSSVNVNDSRFMMPPQQQQVSERSSNNMQYL